MKYAKKMKLVDIDDTVLQQPTELYQTRQSDDKFLAPRTLSTLHSSMNDILARTDIPDSEKWMFYNQILQKFLNYMKNSRQQLLPEPQPILPKINHRNQSMNSFNGHISNNTMNGVFPVRDSIDYITQDNVRTFFQRARENADNNKNINHSSPISHAQSSLSTVSPIHSSSLPVSPTHSVRENQSPMDMDFQSMHSSPEMSSPLQRRKNTPNREKAPLRRAPKRTANQNISCVPPRKIRQQNDMEPRALFRQRPATRTNNDLYWQPTTAR